MAPGSADAAQAAIRQWIGQQHDELNRSSYYHLLQVPRDAADRAIRDAYYQLVARLHPDLYTESLDRDTRQKLITLYSRVVEAYRTLSDPQKRATYDKGLAQGRMRWSPEDESRQRRDPALDIGDANARRFFEMGRKALSGGDARSAVLNLKLALSAAPGNKTIRDELAKAEAAAKK